MATLNLTAVWLNLLSTGASVSAQSSSRSMEYVADGEVRAYAGGRRRSVSGEGVTTTFSATLLLLTQTKLDTIVSWLGQAVQFRDYRGVRLVGVFFKVTPVEVAKGTTIWHAAITLTEVTTEDGV